jgi:hypothetical protein
MAAWTFGWLHVRAFDRSSAEGLWANGGGDFSEGNPNASGCHHRATYRSVYSDPAVSAAALLMPHISTLQKLAEVALALRAHPGWTVRPIPVEASRWDDLLAICVAREIPFEGRTLPSEALVLGPFAEFPPTRQSPVLALEIYAGEPMSHDPKMHEASTKANLAHMDLGPDIEPATIDKMWEASKAARRISLGLTGALEDNRAKAKVSFVIPTSLAQQLGCTP